MDNKNLNDYFDKLSDETDNKINNNTEICYSKNCVKCPNCKSKKNIFSDHSNGYKLCTNCGLIISDILQNDAEWRWYGDHDSKGLDPTRCGIPINPLLPKSSMGTYIGGNRFGSLQRLHSWNAMPSDERSLWHVFEDINIKTQNTDLVAKIKDEAKMYYKMLSTTEECIE